MKNLKFYSLIFIISVIICTLTKIAFKHILTIDDYKKMAQETAHRHQIDVSLLFAIVQQESGWNPKAISHAGAIGLMQIMPSTGHWFCGLTKKQLFDPQNNLECGTSYFAKQLKDFGSVKLALCAYNAGPTRVRKLGRCPRFKETMLYTRNILAAWKKAQ